MRPAEVQRNGPACEGWELGRGEETARVLGRRTVGARLQKTKTQQSREPSGDAALGSQSEATRGRNGGQPRPPRAADM